MSSENDKLEMLLGKVAGVLDEKRQQIEYGCNDYSLLSSVHKVSDEVKLHSGFIYSMINPESLHYMGTLFLKRFMIDVLGVSDFSYKNAEVYKEICLDDKDSRIDLFITDGNKFYVIENKIHAADQPDQIERYIASVRSRYDISAEDTAERIFVYYLTKGGKEPTKSSLGKYNLAESGLLTPVWSHEGYGGCVMLHLVSYKEHIQKWVISCLNHTNIKNLSYAFQEYHDVLQRLLRTRKDKVTTVESYLVGMAFGNTEGDVDSDVEQFKLAAEVGRAWEGTKAQVLSVFFERIVDACEDRGAKIVECKEEIGGDYTSHDMREWVAKKGNKGRWQYKGFCLGSAEARGVKVGVFLATSYIYIGVSGNDGELPRDYKNVAWSKFQLVKRIDKKGVNLRVINDDAIDWLLGGDAVSAVLSEVSNVLKI